MSYSDTTTSAAGDVDTTCLPALVAIPTRDKYKQLEPEAKFRSVDVLHVAFSRSQIGERRFSLLHLRSC